MQLFRHRIPRDADHDETIAKLSAFAKGESAELVDAPFGLNARDPAFWSIGLDKIACSPTLEAVDAIRPRRGGS